jgi:hypothetical protein
MLAQAGQGIKDGTFARIRIAGQGDNIIPIIHIDAQFNEIADMVRRAGFASLS